MTFFTPFFEILGFELSFRVLDVILQQAQLLLENPLTETISQSVLKSFYEHKSVNGGSHLFSQKTKENAQQKPESIIDILAESHEAYDASAENRANVLKHLLEHLSNEDRLLLLRESNYSPETTLNLPNTPGNPILRAAVRTVFQDTDDVQTPTRIDSDGRLYQRQRIEH